MIDLLTEGLIVLIVAGLIFTGLMLISWILYILIFKFGGMDHFCQICGEHLEADRLAKIRVCDLCLDSFERRNQFYEKKFQEYQNR